jgi:serine/threonine protein kinase
VEIGRYTVKGPLGQGAMGEVYLAWDPKLKRDVAIKLMDPRIERSEDLIARFEREADTVANLRHPNIVKVYDKDHYQIDGRTRYLIVMEYVEGEDLATLINERKFISFEQKLEIVIKICRALDHAHRREVIHRDIKPSNVRITADGDVCVLDFGLAKFKDAHPVSSQGVFGTPHYMSPEQTLSSRSVDRNTDQFSAALILYELVTCQKPFPVDDLQDSLAYMSAIRSTAHVPVPQILPECSPELVQIIDRALQKRPSDRFQTCGELADALEAFSRTLPQKELALAQAVEELKRKVEQSSPEPDARELEEAVFTTCDTIRFRPKDRAHDYGLNLFRSASLAAQKAKLGDSRVPQRERWAGVARAALKKPAAKRAAIIGPAVLLTTALLVYALLPPQLGRLELSVTPWARVDSIVNVKTGEEVLKGKVETPFNLELPPGSYIVNVSNPKFQPMKFPVDISAGQSNRVHQVFPEFNKR